MLAPGGGPRGARVRIPRKERRKTQTETGKGIRRRRCRRRVPVTCDARRVIITAVPWRRVDTRRDAAGVHAYTLLRHHPGSARGVYGFRSVSSARVDPAWPLPSLLLVIYRYVTVIITILPRTYFSRRVRRRVRRHGGRRTAVLVLSGWRRPGRVVGLLLLVHWCRRRRRRRRGPRYVGGGGGGGGGSGSGGGGAARVLCCCRGCGGGSGRRVGHVTRALFRRSLRRHAMARTKPACVHDYGDNRRITRDGEKKSRIPATTPHNNNNDTDDIT